MSSIPKDALVAFIDTETNGTPSPNKDLHDRLQVHVAQIAVLLCDLNGKEVNRYTALVKPTHFDMPQYLVDNCHGLSIDILNAKGEEREVVMPAAQKLLDASWLICAHNYGYDSSVLEMESQRDYGFFMPPRRALCTMKQMTDICKLPKARGSGYKWPKLIEAYRHCYGKDFEGAHDAMFDTLACREIFLWLLKEGKLPNFA